MESPDAGGGRRALRVNLGSGATPLPGFLNVDVNPACPSVGLVHDLNVFPWPFADDSVDLAVMDHCLEHLVDHNRAVKEVHRILRPGGTVRFTVPHFTWQFAYVDPTHRHFFAYLTFFYYAKECGYFDFKFSSCKARIVFGKTLSFWNHLLEPLFNLFPNVYEQSPLRIFPAVSVVAILRK